MSPRLSMMMMMMSQDVTGLGRHASLELELMMMEYKTLGFKRPYFANVSQGLILSSYLMLLDEAHNQKIESSNSK